MAKSTFITFFTLHKIQKDRNKLKITNEYHLVTFTPSTKYSDEINKEENINNEQHIKIYNRITNRNKSVQ